MVSARNVKNHDVSRFVLSRSHAPAWECISQPLVNLIKSAVLFLNLRPEYLVELASIHYPMRSHAGAWEREKKMISSLYNWIQCHNPVFFSLDTILI